MSTSTEKRVDTPVVEPNKEQEQEALNKKRRQTQKEARIKMGRLIAGAASRDDQEAWKHSVVNIVSALQNNKGPSITLTELVRLVDFRIRNREKSEQGKDTAEIVTAEIDAILDLTEVCYVCLQARTTVWEERMNDYCEGIDEQPLTEREMRIKTAIYAEKSDLNFVTGLTRMGVPGANADERERRFRQFLKGWKKMPDDEIDNIVDRLKLGNWPSADLLWVFARNWLRWFEAETVKSRAEAGKISAAKQEAKRAAAKAKESLDVKSVPKRSRQNK